MLSPRPLFGLAAALTVVSLASSPATAQIPPGYYGSVDASTSSSLRTTLHPVIDDHMRFPYSSGGTDTWDILELAQEDPNNSSNILDVYRNASYTKVGGGNSNYNREHTWPNGYGFPDDGGSNYPYTDCHQLFLCDEGYNNTRGSRPFDNAPTGGELTTFFNDGQGGGSGVYPGQSNWTTSAGTLGRWETWSGRRGDVARALLYLDIRYEGGLHNGTGANEPDLILTDNLGLIAGSQTGNNESVAYMGLLSVLLQWHAEDPVDDFERDRHEVVYTFQGNRNPFIDHPEWVDCLYGVTCTIDTTPPAVPTGLVVTLEGNAQVSLDWADNGEPDLLGYEVFRSTTMGGPYTEVTGVPLGSSDYTDNGLTNGTTYHYVVAAVDTSSNLSADSAEVFGTPMGGGGTPGVGDVWINELHYDNASSDVGEFVELAGPVGLDLAGWTIVLYNGNGGAVYDTLVLSGTFTDQQAGFGTRTFFPAQIQNGGPDGLALVDDQGDVVEFLSYEGTFVAVGGAAAGMLSTDIGVEESFNTLVGDSLQLMGSGSQSSDFTWSPETGDTPGAVNVGQTFLAPADPWTDLGLGLAGINGVPSLVGTGPLTVGSTITLELTDAAPSTSTTLVVGFTLLAAPFKGGTLVPTPTLLLTGLPTDAAGAFMLSAPWVDPSPSGLTLYLQSWTPDGAAPFGLSASNGLQGDVP